MVLVYSMVTYCANCDLSFYQDDSSSIFPFPECANGFYRVIGSRDFLGSSPVGVVNANLRFCSCPAIDDDECGVSNAAIAVHHQVVEVHQTFPVQFVRGVRSAVRWDYMVSSNYV